MLAALRHVLRPLVRVLLRHGVTWGEFAELGKEVFVEIARADYGLQGRPTNSSRVALMTGLSRREVMRVKGVLVGERTADTPAPGRISQILTAWHVDPRFLAGDGRPAVLPETGEGASLATLLRSYAGDSPHGAVIKELQDLGLVERSPGGYRVLAREYIRSPADPDRLRQASAALHDHATTIAWNIDPQRTGPARFERMASHRALPRRLAPDLEAFVRHEGQALLVRVDEWLASRAGQPDGDVVRAGVGLYLIHDDAVQEPRS